MPNKIILQCDLIGAHTQPGTGVVPGPLRPVGAGPTPALGAVGGEPLAVFSYCLGPVGAQNPIYCPITEYLANNTPAGRICVLPYADFNDPPAPFARAPYMNVMHDVCCVVCSAAPNTNTQYNQ
jgi:hypothetical protein